jgi:uncharacterized NAD(P)/FAD-binding protein YdhS
VNAPFVESGRIRAIGEYRSVRTMLRVIRSAVEEGADWRALLDALRGQTQAIWGALPEVEKRRFLRHLRPYWDIHRHRIPQESHQVLRSLITSGRLMVQKRRYRSICAQGAGFVVESSSRDLVCRDEFDAVFDCRGLWTDLLKSGNSLVQSIIDEGLGMPDTLHLGFCCADSGRVINVSGDDKPALYTLGSLRRGELWETTAAREIRIQAATIAWAIVRE